MTTIDQRKKSSKQGQANNKPKRENDWKSAR